MLFPVPLPVAVGVHLAGVVCALNVVDEACGVALDALTPIPLEAQGAFDSYDVIGTRATVRLLLTLFGGLADPCRVPQCHSAIVRLLQDFQASGRNTAGLERAALAARVAVAGLDEVSELLDQAGYGDEVYGPIMAASFVLETIAAAIDANAVGFTPRRDILFGSN